MSTRRPLFLVEQLPPEAGGVMLHPVAPKAVQLHSEDRLHAACEEALGDLRFALLAGHGPLLDGAVAELAFYRRILLPGSRELNLRFVARLEGGAP